MAVTSSGEIKLKDDVVDEFGGSAPHAISEYYRGGSEVSAANTNVPESGEIQLSDFYGAQDAIVANASNNQTNISLSSVFGGNWSNATAKIYNVPSGVTVGATSGNYAISVNSGMGGTLTINVSGAVQGYGGTPGGSGGLGGLHSGFFNNNSTNGSSGNAGGHAIAVASSNVTINNNSGGSISGGGGSGGGGGGGGAGRQYGNSGPYSRGGSGGTGGVGQGYNQSNTNGSNGTAYTPGGGSNIGAGAGGNGGNGGTFGNNGASGGNGANGNWNGAASIGTAGRSGGSGGSAGKAIHNNGASWTNGTTSGTYHGSYT